MRILWYLAWSVWISLVRLHLCVEKLSLIFPFTQIVAIESLLLPFNDHVTHQPQTEPHRNPVAPVASVSNNKYNTGRGH
jgi:hypothetical protein